MMKLRQLLSRLVCAALCAACVFSTVPMTALAEDEPTTVRVGFFAFDGYHMQDDAGGRSGYGYELLQRLAGYADLRYEYVGYDKSWSEIQELLADGEIDILTSAQKTDARLERFDFTESSIGTSSAILTAKAGDYKYQPEDYPNWNGMRIGMLKDNSRNAGLEEYARLHGFSFEPVYFEDTDDMLRALQTDESIDAVLTSNLRRLSGESVLAQFDSSPFYVMVRKGNTELLEKLDHAIAQLDRYEPGFRTKLMNEYYPTQDASALFFTADERSFMERMRGRSFTAVLNPDRSPYSCLKDGALEGSFYEAAQEIIARSGLNIEFLLPKDRGEYWQLLKDGAADICFDAEADYSRAEELGYWQTPSYMEVPIARLYHEAATDLSRAALLRNSSIAGTYADSELLSGMPITYCDSVAELANAVLSDRRTVALLPQNTAAVAVRVDQTNRLVSEPVYGYGTKYAISVSMRQSPLLYSILSKCASSLSEADMAAFNRSYEDVLEKPFSLIGYLYDYPLHIVLFALGVLLVLILVTSLVSVSRRKKVALLEKERELNDRLQKHHDFLQHLYDTLPCAVFRYSYEAPHRILSYNAACARLYGYQGDAPFVGRTPDAVVSPGT